MTLRAGSLVLYKNRPARVLGVTDKIDIDIGDGKTKRVRDKDVIALHPRVVHIMIGTNDIAGNTGPTSVAAYQANIRAMVDLARVNGVRVVLGSIPPAKRMDWRPGLEPAPRIAELNRWLRAFAAEQGLVYADYHGVLATPDGALRPELGKDGVHPEAPGYALMRPIAERALAEAEAAYP